MGRINLIATSRQLDEKFFKPSGEAGWNYRGSSILLLLPVIAGIALGVYTFFTAASIPNIYSFFWGYGFVLMLVNELLLFWRVFILRGLFRKFFYPVFVAIFSLATFFFTAYIAYVSLWLVIGVIVLSALASGAFKSSSSSDSSTSYSQPENDTPEEVTLSNGTVLKHNYNDEWLDSAKNSYERNLDGTFSRRN